MCNPRAPQSPDWGTFNMSARIAHAAPMSQAVSLLIDVCVIVFIHFDTALLEVWQLMKMLTGCVYDKKIFM